MDSYKNLLASFTQDQSRAGVPYPFCDLPPVDEPITDLRLADILGPILAHIAGLAQVLSAAAPDDVRPDQQRAVHGLLAAQSQAAHTIFRRWMEDRWEDETPPTHEGARE
jgi:hypothetical protein